MITSFLCPFEEQDMCKSIPDVVYNKLVPDSIDYLSGITPNDSVFANGSLVKFVDGYGRSVIAIKCIVSCSEYAENSGEYVALAFQDNTKEMDWVFRLCYTVSCKRVDLTWFESLIFNKQQEFTSFKTFDYNVHQDVKCLVTLADLAQPNPMQNSTFLVQLNPLPNLDDKW